MEKKYWVGPLIVGVAIVIATLIYVSTQPRFTLAVSGDRGAYVCRLDTQNGTTECAFVVPSGSIGSVKSLTGSLKIFGPGDSSK